MFDYIQQAEPDEPKHIRSRTRRLARYPKSPEESKTLNTKFPAEQCIERVMAESDNTNLPRNCMKIEMDKDWMHF